MASPKTKPLLITTLVVIILIIVAVVAAQHYHHKKLPPAQTIVTTDQPTLGNIHAKNHIVAFEDLKCGNCKIYNNLIYPKIKKNYIDTGKAKYTVITLAFIPGSKPAGNAARCLYKQNPRFFFPFIKYVYSHQPPEDQNWATIATLLQFAKNATPNANLTKLSQCIIENRYYSFLKNNINLAAKLMHGQVATPTLFINGRIVDPLSMDQIHSLMNGN